MARIYARRKGRSGSHRPYVTENPSWVPLSPQEIEEIVVELAKKGMSTSLIGIYLRDQYAVPDVKLATGKSLLQILREHDLAPQIPEDLMNLMRKAVSLADHLESNPKDLHNRRGLQLTESKIRRLVKYYKRKGVLSPTWNYSLSKARLIVE